VTATPQLARKSYKVQAYTLTPPQGALFLRGELEGAGPVGLPPRAALHEGLAPSSSSPSILGAAPAPHGRDTAVPMRVTPETAASTDAVQALLLRVSALERDLSLLRELVDARLRREDPGPISPSQSRVAAEPSAAWHVTMLGGFRVQRGGVQAQLCVSRRGQSILKFLLASPEHSASQAVLIETFWPAAEPGTGGHNLQMAIHALRRSLGGWGPDGSDEVVLFRHNRYLLNPALVIDQDVERFQQAYASGLRATREGDLAAAQRQFEQARVLYSGGYLSDSPYEDWAESQRTRLEDMHLSVLGQLSRRYFQLRDWDLVAACCQEILAIDAYREDAYRQLMRCSGAQGRRADVQRTFHTCQEVLLRELQVQPSFETQRVYRALLDDSDAPPTRLWEQE
jgi:DNA-binding SARP family transcriptional activator